MVKILVASKNTVELELFVDGKIEVKPLPHASFSEETIQTLAQAHQVFVERYLITKEIQDLVELAVVYFESKGYSVKEKS